MKEKTKDIARKIARMSSSDLDELSTELMQHGISATMYRFVSSEIAGDYPFGVSSSTSHLPYETTTVYKVTLDWIPNNKKLQTVKMVKELLGLGLREAKHLVDYTPSLLKEFATKEDAERIQNELEDIGCDVEIEKM